MAQRIAPPRPWTDDERDFLRRVWYSLDWTRLAIFTHLGRSPPSVATMAKSMGLGRRAHGPRDETAATVEKKTPPPVKEKKLLQARPLPEPLRTEDRAVELLRRGIGVETIAFAFRLPLAEVEALRRRLRA
jgi:hypothetical protein